MKTVVQIILEMSKKLNGVGFHNWVTNNQSELLKKEKEQIARGYEAGYYYRFEGGEDYYSKTYTKPLNNG